MMSLAASDGPLHVEGLLDYVAAQPYGPFAEGGLAKREYQAMASPRSKLSE